METVPRRVGKKTSDVMDWARAKAFLDALKANPDMKLRLIRRELGYESESAFNAFAYRVFDCSPQGAKKNLQAAEQEMYERYAAIEACLTQVRRKTETENRNGKPKQKTENDFSWKKEKKKVR